MKTTAKLLLKAGACDGEWQAAFKEMYPKGFNGDWTLEEQLQVLRSPLRQWLGWAVDNQIVPMWSLSGANLSGANLSGANLSRANLSRAYCPEGVNLPGWETGANGFLERAAEKKAKP